MTQAGVGTCAPSATGGESAGVEERAGKEPARAKERAVASEWREGARQLVDVRYVVLFLGAVTVRGAWATVAIGVTADGVKRVLGLWRGCGADVVVARTAVEGLSARGLDVSQGLLVVHDGSQALDAAVSRVWGRTAVIAHCQQCVWTDVLAHLPEQDRPRVRRELQAVSAASGEERSRQLVAVTAALTEAHPGAAQRLKRSGPALCSVSDLDVPSPLREHLQSLGPIRQLGTVAAQSRGSAAGPAAIREVLPAVQAGMRRISGYQALPALAERLGARVAARS